MHDFIRHLFSLLELATVFAFVLAIIFIRRHSGGRNHGWNPKDWRWGNSAPTGEDQAILDDLGKVAERMERRLDTLEKILEADDPKWKERAQ